MSELAEFWSPELVDVSCSALPGSAASAESAEPGAGVAVDAAKPLPFTPPPERLREAAGTEDAPAAEVEPAASLGGADPTLAEAARRAAAETDAAAFALRSVCAGLAALAVAPPIV